MIFLVKKLLLTEGSIVRHGIRIQRSLGAGDGIAEVGKRCGIALHRLQMAIQLFHQS